MEQIRNYLQQKYQKSFIVFGSDKVFLKEKNIVKIFGIKEIRKLIENDLEDLNENSSNQ